MDNRKDFKVWLNENTPETCRKYCIEFLSDRKRTKGIIYGPCQVETKTFMLPGIKYMNEHLGGYEAICSEAGLFPRFTKYAFDVARLHDVSHKVIFTDTREQKPLTFENRNRWKSLKFGDYRMAGSSIYIERKSLSDIWGTLTVGYSRFEREIERALETKAYLVILVESPFFSLEGYIDTRKRIAEAKILEEQESGKEVTTKLPKIKIEFLYHNIRKLLQKYQHIQFLFVRDREESSRVIPKLFSADEQVRDVDLQLLYDRGEL